MTLTDARIGGNTTVDVAAGKPAATGIVFLGVANIGAPFDLSMFGANCQSSVNIALPTVIVDTFAVPPSGSWSKAYPVPNDPNLNCAKVTLQTWFGTVASRTELSNSWQATIGN